MEPYKRIIQKAVNPSLENNEDLNLNRAKNEILRYSKSIDDIKGEAELLVTLLSMDMRFSHHNSHLENPERFALTDPHLKRLKVHPFLHRSSLLDSFPIETPGIYTLSGARQVGKTTLIKQWMAHPLRSSVTPECIAYVTGELIDDQHSLVRLLDAILQNIPGNTIGYLIIDEVTYIRDWDKGIKYLAIR